MAKPVNKEQTVELEIIDINFRGQGVGKIDNYVVFVDNVLPKDKIKAKIINAKSKYAIGKVVEIIERNEDFQKPLCPYFFQCGGCQIMHMTYPGQLNYKKKIIINELKRNNIKNIEEIKINETIGMDDPYRYRNKGSFPVGKKNGKLIIGPYKQNSHDIVDIKDCIIQNEYTEEIIKTIREFIEKNKIQTYDENTHEGSIKHILMRTNKSGDLMIVIVSRNNIDKLDTLVKNLIEKIPKTKSIYLNINNKKTNRILGNKNINIYGEEYLIDNIFDLEFKVYPETFFQINPSQVEKLYDKAIEYANIKKEEIIYDLYCGVGTISLLAAKKAKEVHGIEVVEESIKSAKDNKKLNNIENTNFHTGKVEEVLPKLYSRGIKADTVILDPPRKGCEEKVLDTIIEMKAQKIVYVSCNPSTLARDLRILEEGGYIIKEIQPVDMFGHSVHVEAVTLLTRYS